MTSPLTNRSILVTGATGSFGQAFTRHALTVGAEKVVVFSRDELKQHDMRIALVAEYGAQLIRERVRFVLGSVTERDEVLSAMWEIDLVVHAAAMKQVPACEENPGQAFQINAFGTRTVAHAAIAAGVKKAVFLSTDKAAAPNTHYGYTKAAGERLWNLANVYAAGKPTRLACTRYGNVIGSRGSVVPIFREQLREKGRVTITHPAMTRFWMRLCDGVRLVETALANMRGGEVFIPKAGAAGILQIARAIHAEIGEPPFGTFTPLYEVIGIRRGEKLHETLISEDEARDAYDMGSHYLIEPERSWEYLPPLNAPKVPDGFSYRSDNNPHQLSVDELRELIA